MALPRDNSRELGHPCPQAHAVVAEGPEERGPPFLIPGRVTCLPGEWHPVPDADRGPALPELFAVLPPTSRRTLRVACVAPSDYPKAT